MSGMGSSLQLTNSNGGGGLPLRADPSGDHRPADLLPAGHAVGQRPGVAARGRLARSAHGRAGRRAGRAAAAPDRLRRAVAGGRRAADAAGHAARAAVQRDRAGRGGRSPGWVRHVVDWGGQGWSLPPGQRGRGGGLDPDRASASGCSPRRAAGGPGSAGWPAWAGAWLVWIFGEAFGGLFTPGAELAVRCAGRGAAVRGGRAAHRAARPGLAGRPAGPAAAGRAGLFLAGMAVLQAWPGRGFWQGTAGRQPGNLASMVAGHVADLAAGVPGRLVRGVRLVHRRARVRGQPGRGDRAGRRPGVGACSAARRGCCGPPSGCCWCCAPRSGCWSRTWASSAAWAPTRTA